MVALEKRLNLKRCPHCQIANPNIIQQNHFETQDANGGNQRIWITYVCQSCGGALLGSRTKSGNQAQQLFPEPTMIEECIPEKAREFLNQAINSLNAPAGSIMLSASSIDAMLKDIGYKEGSLFERIEKAVKDNRLTPGMSEWAHLIRLEANDQRHADDKAELPNEEDARKIVDFAIALAQFLYVLPNKVKMGIEESK
ncbi:MAG: DUF4145 domain-containing protein [Deltaproteobacteria bacterium]|nr:DUF4145 domain-containing protein [Deltaproteobacteria bacterium]